MFIADKWKDYEVIDTSCKEKLERWGDKLLVRPRPPGHLEYLPLPPRLEAQRGGGMPAPPPGGGQWVNRSMPERWPVSYGPLTFNVKPMNF